MVLCTTTSVITCSYPVFVISRVDKSSLLFYSYLAAGESPETVLDCGLIKGHAYCVTDVKKVCILTVNMSVTLCDVLATYIVSERVIIKHSQSYVFLYICTCTM